MVKTMSFRCLLITCVDLFFTLQHLVNPPFISPTLSFNFVPVCYVWK